MGYWFFILGIPATFLAVVAAFGWRYRKAIRNSMIKSGAAIAVPPPTPAPRLLAAGTPLQVEKIRENELRVIGSAAEQSINRAKAITRSASRCFLISGGILWGALVALQVWTAPPSWQEFLSLVVLFAALPGLIVMLNVIVRSWRTWAVIGVIYCAIVTLAIVALSWYSGNASRATAVALALANLYAWPALTMLFLVQRSLRPLVVGIAPLLVFAVVGVAAVSLAVSTSALPADIADFKQRPEYRWPVSLMLAVAWAALPASVWIFLRMLRSRNRLKYVIPLAVIGVAGVAADELLQPAFPLGPIAFAVPAVVLQCAVVWLFFKSLVGLETARWLAPQALQFHLCWLFLAIYTLAVLGAAIDGMSPAERQVVYVIFGASLVAYVGLLHALLRAARRSSAGIAPKRLLLLRVFGAVDKRERLLDALEDTWRRVGCVDLIAGADLAMRTLRSWMVECFLLRRVDGEFLRSGADLDQRVARLHSELEGDLRYPVNEICCYVDVWQAAVVKLAATADVVLLDLRGFTRESRGCEFELTHLIWHVPLARVVVLADNTTDERAMHDVAQAAWTTLPRDSANARANASQLSVLSLDGQSTLASIPAALFRAAGQDTA